MPAEPKSRLRQSYTHEERAALREQKRIRPQATIAELQDWFLETFERSISRSSVSRALADKLDFLDKGDVRYNADARRQRSSNWPVLEDALYRWCKRKQHSVTITGDILKAKAEQFWCELEQYRDLPMPKFSNGFLNGFLKRNRIESHKRIGKAGSVPVGAENEMARLREILGELSPKDIYNCDESALYWKMMPGQGHSTRTIPGATKENSKVTVTFCCNADGSDKLPLWFIGSVKNSRAFETARVEPRRLGVFWRSNRSCWMTNSIFEEYLLWFDRRMAGRRVFLLLDNFSPHSIAFDRILAQLKNTTILWLPANSTSRYQPLEQGIIQAWKVHWRRRWVEYICDEADNDRDAMSTMDIVRAIRWATHAWDVDITSTTIANCFEKAFGPPSAEGIVELDTYAQASKRAIREAVKSLEESHVIRDAMDLSDFLDPSEELMEDNDEDIDREITEALQPEQPEPEENEPDPVGLVSHREALESLRLLRTYEEQTGGNVDLVTQLNLEERAIALRQHKALKQNDRRDFFRL